MDHERHQRDRAMGVVAHQRHAVILSGRSRFVFDDEWCGCGSYLGVDFRRADAIELSAVTVPAKPSPRE